jgi:hypothetical protein
LKKNYFSSHKLPKQQSTSFWSQGILGVNNPKSLLGTIYILSKYPLKNQLYPPQSKFIPTPQKEISKNHNEN